MKIFTNHKYRWEIRVIDDTTVEIYIRCKYPETVRLCLLNRTDYNATFNVAEPGIGGNFNTSVRWAFHFPAKRAGIVTIGKALENSQSCGWGKGDYFEAFTEALLKGAHILKDMNYTYIGVHNYSAKRRHASSKYQKAVRRNKGAK